MLRELSAILIVLASGVPSAAYPADDRAQAFSVIGRFLDAANHRRLTDMLAETAPVGEVTDDLPPYHWAGRNAFRDWATVVGRNWDAHGVTSATMAVTSDATEVSGDNAYAAEAAHFAIRAGAKGLEQNGLLVFSLVRIGNTWKIRSMAWGPAR